MKKFVCVILAMMMALCSFAAFAEETETAASPELEVTVEILSAVPEGFALIVTPIEDADEASVDVYNTVAADATVLTADLEGEYNVDEIMAVNVAGYEEGMGDVTVALTVPTEYAEDAKVVAKLAVAGEGFTTLATEVKDGAVVVTLTEDQLAKLAAQQGVLAILSAAE